jgi:hypothetical protein
MKHEIIHKKLFNEVVNTDREANRVSNKIFKHDQYLNIQSDLSPWRHCIFLLYQLQHQILYEIKGQETVPMEYLDRDSKS